MALPPPPVKVTSYLKRKGRENYYLFTLLTTHKAREEIEKKLGTSLRLFRLRQGVAILAASDYGISFWTEKSRDHVAQLSQSPRDARGLPKEGLSPTPPFGVTFVTKFEWDEVNKWYRIEYPEEPRMAYTRKRRTPFKRPSRQDFNGLEAAAVRTGRPTEEEMKTVSESNMAISIRSALDALNRVNKEAFDGGLELVEREGKFDVDVSF